MHGKAPSRASGAARHAGARAALTCAVLLGLTVLLRPPATFAATPRVHAVVGARIVTAPGKVIEKGTVVMRDGIVVAVGADVSAPPDARIWNGEGLTVYPGLIDPFVAPDAKARSDARAASEGGAGHELASVTPERHMSEGSPLPARQREKLRAAGFALVNVVPGSGVIRGQSAVVGLGDGTMRDNLIRADVAQILSIETSGSWTTYPGSRMGAIATIRQTLMDAAWYRDAQAAYAKSHGHVERPEFSLALDALQPALDGSQKVVVNGNDMLGVLSAARIANEAGIEVSAVGAGDGYKRTDEIAESGLALIVPIDFPDAPEVADPADAIEVTTETLRHWQNAPNNPAALVGAGVRVSLTSRGLDPGMEFRANVRQAIERGLTTDQALAAVTVEPARLLGIDDRAGTIAAGRPAHLTVTKGDLFSKNGDVESVWIDGNRYEVTPPPGELEGDWAVGSGANALTLAITGGASPGVKVIAGRDTVEASDVEYEPTRLSFVTRGDARRVEYDVWLCRGRLCGTRTEGTQEAALAGIRAPEADDPSEDESFVESPVVMGNSEPWRMREPEQPEAVLVRNATIWTSGPQGTLDGADLLVRRGKIAAVGVGLEAPKGAVVIDAGGKHVSPGIIDEHSHAAVLGGVNECTNSNTSEVRIGDVINSESVNIYRQLAGGVTIMHLLHGSCNAIGGQCAAIKNRWGAGPDALLVTDIPPTIKFALGENVKGSNATGPRSTRYPQTRGGVEQFFRTEFQRAVDYRAAFADYRAGKRTLPPRRDLQMDALVEILEGKRQIHCHSYRQDEILALIRVADEFGFRVNTFTHILEGYKVADEMAEHGAAGSCFSDWWAYKFEVYDAIPYNGYLMWDRGVTVAFNSDSPELARRLHSEAAKAVKYGGVPREEAIKFVTLNPAKTLMIDDRVGSLEPGKDADFVIWSGSPLSPYSFCEQTWIDGRKYFDRIEDLRGREALANERAALIANARAAADEEDGSGRSRGPTYAYLRPGDFAGNSCGSEEEYHDAEAHRLNGEVER